MGSQPPADHIWFRAHRSGVGCYLVETGLAFGISGVIPRGASLARLGIAGLFGSWVLVGPTPAAELTLGAILSILVVPIIGERIHHSIVVAVPGDSPVGSLIRSYAP